MEGCREAEGLERAGAGEREPTQGNAHVCARAGVGLLLSALPTRVCLGVCLTVPADARVQGKWELLRHVSFVDCPGHDILMATMLNGAAVMDAALLLVAGNESCPQPQTAEHLAAVEIMKLQNIIILQNKIDLVKEQAALQQYDDIKAFIEGTVAEKSPIIPISAQLKYNIDVVAEYMAKCIPIPTRDFVSDPRMIIIRSFDVNKPGQEVIDLTGGAEHVGYEGEGESEKAS